MTNDRTNRDPEQTSGKGPADTSGTEAVYRMIDLIARRTAEQHADGEFTDAPKLSRRGRPNKRR